MGDAGSASVAFCGLFSVESGLGKLARTATVPDDHDSETDHKTFLSFEEFLDIQIKGFVIKTNSNGYSKFSL